MKLSEMKQVLSSGDIQLTKSLGQNFLHDQNQLRRIAAAGQLEKSDAVLEIGPGLGPLTELLLAEAGQVVAVEKDHRLVGILQERFARHGHFRLHHADALDLLRSLNEEKKNVRTIFLPANATGAVKVISNLPYSVASPILVELAENLEPPRTIVVTLQLEVAQRIMAAAGDDDYGVLSLLLQRVYEPAGLFKIPASCFFPAPDVDSACITLQRRAVPLLNAAEAALFTRVVKRAFSQRRKMMLKLLKADWPEEQLLPAFAAENLSPQSRAESVSLAAFVGLSRRLHAGWNRQE